MSTSQEQIWADMQKQGIVPTETPIVAEVDPSGVGQPPVVPAVEPVAPVLPEEKVYSWQPTDENDRPIGGRQTIKYRTETEKFEKMQEKSVLLLRQLRKVTREKELGPVVPEVDDAEKFTNVVEFKSRDLSADERFNLSQKLQNPETAAEARDLLLESAFGVKPSVLANTLNETQKFMIQQRAVDNYVEFATTSGEYYDSPANRGTLTTWMSKHNYAPTVANFNRAFQRLIQAGLLEVAPEVHQEIVPPSASVVTPVVPVESEPNPQVPAANTPGLGSEQPQAKRHSHIPSGLNSSVASSAGESPVTGPNVTLADIDKLPADVYKAKMKDPAFRKLVDQLEEDAAKKRRARSLGQV